VIELLRSVRREETTKVIKVDRQRLGGTRSEGRRIRRTLQREIGRPELRELGVHRPITVGRIVVSLAVDDEKVGNLGQSDGLGLDLPRLTRRYGAVLVLGNETRELHVGYDGLRGQRDIQRRGEELHVQEAVLEHSIGA